MAIYIRKSVYDELFEKSFGHKDFSKLTKKQITDKNGHTRNVWVRAGEDEKTKSGKAAGTAELEKISSHKVGDSIVFRYGGNTLTGKIVAMGKDGVTVQNKNGGSYKVRYKNIVGKAKNAEKTIPAKRFNADDYKKSFTDNRATNDEKGYRFIYDSLGETGKEASAITISRLEEQNKRLIKGDTMMRNTVNGEWTAERKKLHETIINKILSPEKIEACKPENGEKPKFIMFGGRGGSGKSWFTDKKRAEAENRKVMFDSDKFLVLDADALKEYIPEYEGWNAGEVHEESSYLNKKIKALAFEKGINIIIDGTMNYNPKKPDKVRNEMLEAKEKGYSLEAHYMFLPVQESAKRAINRFKTKKGDFSGRLVPMNILMSMQDNEKSFDSVKDIVDDWSFRDNQGNSGPKLISKKGLV